MPDRTVAPERRRVPIVRVAPRPVVRKVRRVSRAAERRNPAPVDAFVLSYPKSGRAWLRMPVGQALVMDRELDHFPTDVEGISRRLPDVPTMRFLHDDKSYKVGRPRTPKPH